MIRYFFRKNPWWENEEFDSGKPRTKYLELLKKQSTYELITIITGLRRVGKSTLALQTIKSLLSNSEVNPTNILYFSLDEPSIYRESIKDIINQYRTEFKIKSDEKIYVFIDEIQMREGWELEVKSLYDNENIKFFLTGSSAMLLSENLSYLTGRYLKVTVYPLNFNEYLDFKNVKLKQEDEFILEKYVEEYLVEGGMPEYVLHKPDKYLETTIESILFKDLLSKFKIRNPRILLDLIYLLSDRIGSSSSSLRLSKILEVNKDTVLTYIKYLNKAYITRELVNYSESRNKEIYNASKFYFSDNGVASTYATKVNYGSLVENVLFNFLLRLIQEEKRVKLGYFYENKAEIDFVLNFKNKLTFIESKWVSDIEEVNLKSLAIALKRLNPDNIIYVTKNLEMNYKFHGYLVRFVPLHKFLIGETFSTL